MTYQEDIRKKHEFEDAFNSIIKIVSVLDNRELEMAAAKIGDGLEGGDSLIDPKSALVTAKIIQIALALRRGGELSQSKVMRVWMRRKKKQYAFYIAEALLVQDNKRYLNAKVRAEKLRADKMELHNIRYMQWKRHKDSLSFWQKLFFPGPPEPPPLPNLPAPPKGPADKAKLIAGTREFGDVLIDTLYYYVFPNLEYSSDYVREENVKTTAQQLLESKSD
ncbi:hypothetical protein [Thioalkalivibrio sp. ALE11]|uniref:hypothetical protein n=1 Tax=Thioalkalivibrio sp. ALE11 TaxID=1265494 RepID=UPI0012DE79DE|nr:hypothetical protein [Thioalkalivibrio sp. ALE11]